MNFCHRSSKQICLSVFRSSHQGCRDLCEIFGCHPKRDAEGSKKRILCFGFNSRSKEHLRMQWEKFELLHYTCLNIIGYLIFLFSTLTKDLHLFHYIYYIYHYIPYIYLYLSLTLILFYNFLAFYLSISTTKYIQLLLNLS